MVDDRQGQIQERRATRLRRRAIVTVLASLLVLLGVGEYAHAQREIADRIIATVGNEVILASELGNQLQLIALQTGRRPKSEAEMREFQHEVLDQMISDQLFLIEARKDTSIQIRADEIDRALNEHMNRLANQYDTYEEFVSQLSQEDMTVRDLERRFRPDIENQLLRQRLIQRKLYEVSVSRKEVEDFYNNFRDSIPVQPEAVKLAHLQLSVAPSKQVEDSVRELAAVLRQQVLDGADLGALSAQYSSFGAGANGGDLGWVSRDDVVPEFARAAFNLNVGDISGVIRTDFGYHIIKCEGTRTDRYRLRHILLGVVPTAADTAAAFYLADSLLTEVRGGADFAELAKTYSADDNTRATGGELGWFAVDQLPVEFADSVRGWHTPGEYRGPVKSQFGLHLLYLMDYQPEKEYSLQGDYDEIKELARQDKTGRIVDEWIQEIKAHAYIEIRLEENKP